MPIPPQSPVFPPETSLVNIPGLVPPGFACGIEILNDNTTPMEFVVYALGEHLGMSYTDSAKAMLAIHTKGGALLSTPSLAEAKRIAEAISLEAAQHSHPLICRAVSVI
jgi:ATP-dependent Clp protease adapter protein ClpS